MTTKLAIKTNGTDHYYSTTLVMRGETIVVGASRSLFSSRELSGSHYFNQAKLMW